MPKHKPIKFESTLEPSLKKYLVGLMEEETVAKSILKATLAIIAAGGVLTFAAAVPGLAGGLGRINAGRRKASYERYRRIWRSFNELKKRQELEFVAERDGYLVYRPTKRGKEKIKKFLFDDFKLSRPKKWDGKWRLVIFDIPERRRKDRAALRRKLLDLDFYQCQKSAWIHPFPCWEEIEFLKEILSIKAFVKLFLVDEMTDGRVLYHFKDLLRKVS
jgi:hypothetical protein